MMMLRLIKTLSLTSLMMLRMKKTDVGVEDVGEREDTEEEEDGEEETSKMRRPRMRKIVEDAADADAEISNLMMKLIKTLSLTSLMMLRMKKTGVGVEDVGEREDTEEEEDGEEETSKMRRPRKRKIVEDAADADAEISNLMMKLIKTLSLTSLMMLRMKKTGVGVEDVGER